MSKITVPEAPRIDYSKVAPAAIHAVLGVENYVRQSSLDETTLELVKFRASTLNGCAYCVDMHSKDARVNGETEQRLYAVNVWHEAPFFTPRERAALAWTDAVTLISVDRAPEEVYNAVREHFNEAELVDLTMAIIAINCWNRLAVSFRSLAGTYEPRAKQKTE